MCSFSNIYNKELNNQGKLAALIHQNNFGLTKSRNTTIDLLDFSSDLNLDGYQLMRAKLMMDILMHTSKET